MLLYYIFDVNYFLYSVYNIKKIESKIKTNKNVITNDPLFMFVRRFLLRLCIEEVLLSIVDTLLTPDRFRDCEIGFTIIDGFE